MFLYHDTEGHLSSVISISLKPLHHGKSILKSFFVSKSQGIHLHLSLTHLPPCAPRTPHFLSKALSLFCLNNPYQKVPTRPVKLWLQLFGNWWTNQWGCFGGWFCWLELCAVRAGQSGRSMGVSTGSGCLLTSSSLSDSRAFSVYVPAQDLLRQ